MSHLAGTVGEPDRPGSSPRELRPTHVRWHIVAMLTLVTALTYLDRLNLGIAGKYIQDEYAFNTQTMGWILSAFVLGYALFQVPGGWAGDRYGPRSVLTFAILWWSVFTAATALAPRLPLRGWFGMAWSFVIVRFLIGVGEAAALPNSNKIVAYWMGQARRGIGNSMFLMGVGVGGACTPVLIAWIMQRWGWRMSFYVCGILGVIIAFCWHLYATNHPEEHPRVNAAELAIIQASLPTRARTDAPPTRNVPWRKLLASRSVWGLMLSYFCEGYPNYIYYTWFFLYLVRVRGLTVTQGSVWGMAPFIAVVLLAPLGGWFSDRAVSRLGKRRGRQCTVWVGMSLSAALLWSGAHAANNSLAIVLLAGALGFNIFATSSWWATCIDLTPDFSGSLSAMMNTWGNLGGWFSPILTAYIATRFGWIRALDFAGLVTFAAVILWIFVDAEQSVESERL
jgi:ACS family glucarate transporter-like MFS transporter